MLGLGLILLASILGYMIGASSSTSNIITKTTTETAYSTVSSITTVPTTITETRTQTTTSTRNVTSTVTVSTIRLLPQTFGNNNSRTVSELIPDRGVLVTLSINGSEFHYGEKVGITATITNTSPVDAWQWLMQYEVLVVNRGNDREVWTAPEGAFQEEGLRPPRGWDTTLKPFETQTIPYISKTWNLEQLQNINGSVSYTGKFVPEGNYTIMWRPGFVNSQGPFNWLELQFTVKK